MIDIRGSENNNSDSEQESAVQDQSQLNQVFLLSLLQFQKQKLLEQTAGLNGPQNQSPGSKEGAEDIQNEDSSSNSEIVYDMREGEPCLIDQPSKQAIEKSQNVGVQSSLIIKCALKPVDSATRKYLVDKSSNNINPYVMVETEARTRVTSLIELMSTKIFKEDKQRFILRVHNSKFTDRKSNANDFCIQDLMLAEEPEKLEQALEGDKTIKLVIRYAIRGVSRDKSLLQIKNEDNRDQENLLSNRKGKDEEGQASDYSSDSKDEGLEIPPDIDEQDLTEMLTEVMSIMLFNKDEKLNQYVGQVNEFDLKAKLPHPSDLLGKRRRRKKNSAVDQQKDNEKSEISHGSQSQLRRRETKALAKKAIQTKSYEERLNEYQRNQVIKLENARQRQDQKVQQFMMRKQHQLRTIAEKWCQMDENFDHNDDYLLSSTANAKPENFQNTQEFLNFRLNPYFDNLVRFRGA